MRDWYRIDETRESWVFLVLEVVGDEPEIGIESWEVGVANPSHLLETKERKLSEVSGETELLSILGDELAAWQFSDAVLITPNDQTVNILRSKLAANSRTTSPSFHGFTHISVDSILEKYFYREPRNEGRNGGVSIDSGERVPLGLSRELNSVENIWKEWQRLASLVPAEAVVGVPL